MVTIKILNKQYEVIDAMNNITLADSFVKNKIGTGNGEAKLYVGNEGERYENFFDNLDREFFFLGDDFSKYLEDAEEEFLNPQQDYVKKKSFPQKYIKLKEKIKPYIGKKLSFKIYRVNVAPPRVYLRSESQFFGFMRDMGLPNISYLSVMKIKDYSNNIFYYCRIFIEYRNDIIKYDSLHTTKTEKDSIDLNKAKKNKAGQIAQARVGQGEYRRKLLEECECCPFTLVNDERLLIASHIKPWAKSNDREKIDPKNGFSLTPTYDKLFDQGYITFNRDFTVKVSPWISPMNQKRLHIYDNMKLKKLEKQIDDKREKYLEYHRKYIYKG